MITLPVVTSGTKISTTSTSGAVSAADTGLTTGSGAAAETAENGDAQGFLTLLGNKLLTLAQQGETAGKPAAPQADAAETAPSSQVKLNALLAALDKPESLPALLQPETGKTGKSSDADTTEDKDPVASLNDSDMQTLQALFAMLPPAVNPPAAATVKLSDAPTTGGNEKGAKQTSLTALLATGGAADAETGKLHDSTGKSATGGPGAATGVAAQKTAAGAADIAFQQVAGQIGKESDKENSSSVANATITPNVISAASAAFTPATTSVVTAPATPALNAQLGSQEWQQALGQQILLFSRNGQQTAELHLHPQDLGSIQISLKLDNDQAQLSMISNHSQVRAAAEAAIPHLRAALAESGINLGQSSVSSDAFQQGQSFNGQQEQQRNSRGNTFSLATENDSDITPVAVPASLQARAAGSNAVDIFA